MDVLFVDNNNREYRKEDVIASLRKVGVEEGDTLFIHSDVMFGNPGPGFNRKEYLSILYSCFESIGVKHVIVPTFTYSFPNNESYNAGKSKSLMGSFSEFVRKMENRYRTQDPLLSLSVPADLKTQFQNLSSHSLGENSGMDIVHKLGNVKFLFWGTRLGSCFTYVHYVEKMVDVPYRFDLDFSGTIVDEGDIEKEITQTIHTGCYGVKISDYHYFEDFLFDKGVLKRDTFGNSVISCVSEKDAYKYIKENLEKDINYFLECPFQESDLVHKYTFGLDGTKVTHC